MLADRAERDFRRRQGGSAGGKAWTEPREARFDPAPMPCDELVDDDLIDPRRHDDLDPPIEKHAGRQSSRACTASTEPAFTRHGITPHDANLSPLR